MIGRNAPRAVGAADQVAERPGPVGEWLRRSSGNSYSRRVALLKLTLPAIGATLLLLVVVWPRVAPLFDRLRVAAIDLREARELRMINPRYTGTDRDGRPYAVTAAVGRQVPKRDDVMSLDQPVANVQSHNGAKIVITADSGVYQTQTQYLDMFGDVKVTHENGSVFNTTAARVDIANAAAEGHAPVEGHGPQGDIKGDGFQILDKGDIVIFTGQSNLLLKGNEAQTAAPSRAPADVPASIAQAAAQIAAKAGETQTGRAHPAPATAPAKPVRAAKPKPAPALAAKAKAKAPEHATRPARKPG